MTLAAVRDLAGKATMASETTCDLNVFSDYSDDVTLNVNGKNITLTLAVMGADAPVALSVDQAGYYINYVVTGLKSNTSYPYTLTQAGAITFSGTFETAPGVDDDFAKIAFSCSGGNTDGDYIGGWNFVKAYAEKNPLVNPLGLSLKAVLGVDDTAYLDSMTMDDTAGSGHRLYSPETDAEAFTEYDACTRWMIWAGMRSGATDSGRTLNAREKTRQWCNDNLNHVYLWGDHEVFENVGYGTGANASGTFRTEGLGTSSWQTPALAGYKETAYEIFCPISSGYNFDAESQGFAINYGCLQYMALDRNYGDGGDIEGNGAFLFSQNQVDGFTAALSTSSASFRIVSCASQYHESIVSDIHTMDTNTAAKDGTGKSEIFTNNVDSLMAKHVADGSKWFKFQGDEHVVRVVQHNEDAGGSELQENFLVFSVSLMSSPNSNGVANDVASGEPAKGWYDWGAADYVSATGVDNEYLRVWDHSEVAGYPTTVGEIEGKGLGYCILTEVFGSETPKRMKVSIVDSNLKTNYSCDYLIDGGDNLPTLLRKMVVR